MNRLQAMGRLCAGLIMGALLVPAGASAAPTTPEVTTGGAVDRAPTTVTLKGTVTPNGRETSYVFQFGTTTLYGGQTTPVSVGKGKKKVAVSVPVAGLAPYTTYHYRIVALRGPNPARRGTDRTFRTLRQPLGLTLAATPDLIRPGRSSTLSGNLSGTGNAGRQVVLQSNPFPYTQGFVNASNVQVTDASGNFAFPILSIAFNTQYRVLMPQNLNVQSPIVTIGVKPKVSIHRKRVRRTERGAIYKFSGKIKPAADGTPIAIQRRRDGEWRTITGTLARHTEKGYSKFTKRVRLRRGGRFRIFAGVLNGQYAPNHSRTVRIRHIR